MEYIEIEKNLIPYRFEISLGGTVFIFEVHYNSEFDFFTIDLFRGSETLVTGEKIVYGVPLFTDISDNRFPSLQIIPLDASGGAGSVNWSTFGESVFLYVGGTVG